MKKVYCFLIVLIFVLPAFQPDILAQKVSRKDALTVAGNFLRIRNSGFDIGRSELLTSGKDTLAWIMHCQPVGFIVIAANPHLQPVLAWSTEGNFGEGEAWDSFLPVMKADIMTRNRFADPASKAAASNRQKWEYWLNPETENRLFEQWPPEGWSATGGWLVTNWTQTAPYNGLCPIDGQTQIRSIAGCPATAMAQIVNYHHNLHETLFTNADDYYHNYGTGNMYWIDDDWESRGFPSWDQLNVYLDTLASHYQNGTDLSDGDKATLTYACGVAAKQVYTSSVSGTFGISQAYDAFIRFGYTDAQLVDPSNPELNELLAQNIMLALPAHLGLVNPGWTVGHNVVVDGYNTDELYHFNFGWGGSANGWYSMPPKDIPYDLTVIEGVVLDINLSNPPVGTTYNNLAKPLPAMAYIRETGVLRISLPDTFTNGLVCIYDATGRKVFSENITCTGIIKKTDLQIPNLGKGLYIASLESGSGNIFGYKFVR